MKYKWNSKQKMGIWTSESMVHFKRLRKLKPGEAVQEELHETIKIWKIFA